MLILRWGLLLGLIGAILLASASVEWSGVLFEGNQSWRIQLGRHQLWSPPSPPDIQAFKAEFGLSKELLSPNSFTKVQVTFELQELILRSLVFCWPVMFIFGALYGFVRKSQPDLLLHCSFHLAVWQLPAFLVSVVMMLLMRWWMIEANCCVGLLCLSGGLYTGLLSFKRETRKSEGEFASGVMDG